MMGLVTGDALGNAIQFMSREEVRERGFVHDMEEGGVYETPAGTWTDDSSMALATLDSIREIGAVVPEDIMLNFVSWECHGEYTPFGEAFDGGAQADTDQHHDEGLHRSSSIPCQWKRCANADPSSVPAFYRERAHRRTCGNHGSHRCDSPSYGSDAYSSSGDDGKRPLLFHGEGDSQW